jgi:PAS domain S-box-containing protein
VQSSYQVPLYAEGMVLAALSLCSVRERRGLTRELLQRQRLIGEVFVNALTRKGAEERQRESEARFRIVADSAPVLIWMSGVDQRCTFFNKTWLDFTGRTLEQELGNGWAEGVHRADLERCLRSYVEAFNARTPFVLQYRLCRHDGAYRWISDNGVPRYDAKGNFAGYIGSCVDFTERKEAEEHMTLAAEAANLGMWMWDIPRGKVWSTEKFRELFGFTDAEEISFDKIQERIHPQDRLHRQETLERALKTAGSYEVEYRVVTAEGVERWIASKGRADHDEEGRPTRVVGVCIDITERRRVNLEVTNLRHELAHSSRVSLMGQLASSLAHELNQPLGAILRNAEAAELFLQSPKPDLEELRHIILDIRNDDRRAGGVIERLRQLLKRRDIEKETLDAGTLAEEVVPLLHRDALGRRVALELETTPGLPLVRGDRVQLQQVLLNLVMNGMDAVGSCPPDRRRVKLRVGRDGDGFVALAVSDSGHGIPADKLRRLFEPFFTTKANGMGLGLSISRSIVEAHGGRISAVNNPEGGATFRFTVPVANGGSGGGN